VLLFLTNAVRRDGEVAHLLLTGPGGAGKMTTALRMKDLCDPTNPPLSAAPWDVLGLVALAKGQGITALNNTSSISPDAADMLCGFATGTAHTARQLYSNGDLYSAEVLAPVMFTTMVPDLSSRPDPYRGWPASCPNRGRRRRRRRSSMPSGRRIAPPCSADRGPAGELAGAAD
jgi:hypothetical protein